MKPESNHTPKRCPYVSKCGSCAYQNMTYANQLAVKQSEEKKLLSSFGTIEPILGMSCPYYYRNKVHAAFDRDKHGNVISGVYEEGSHRIVNTSECLIEDRRAGEIIQIIKKLAIDFRIKIYDERRGDGLLRRVLVRTGHSSGQILVVLVMASTFFPSKNNFIKELRRRCPDITTIVVNINNKHDSMILGDRSQVEFGKGTIEDTLCGKTFRISAKSFYQVNPVQTERLYQTAVDYAGLTGAETIIDAYSGIGTIGMIASDHAGKVISVETNKDAVRDAKLNAKLNNIRNIEIHEQDAGRFMCQMAEEQKTADVVFMDPPRAGSSPEFIRALLLLAPSRIIYISCNPETLARDLKLLTRAYSVQKMQPVDMFPWTAGIETVVKLVRKNPDV